MSSTENQGRGKKTEFLLTVDLLVGRANREGFCDRLPKF